MVTRTTQPSNALIDEERTGFVEASLVIPLLAFITAMFVAAVACARVDDARRRRLAMTRTTVIGALVGTGLGLVAAAIIGPKLTRSVSIPNHVGASHLLPALGALLLTAGAGLLAFGLASDSIATSAGGTLLVDPLFFSLVPIAQAGTSMVETIPRDPTLCGASIYLQVLELDFGAPFRISFTPGLQLTFGH